MTADLKVFAAHGLFGTSCITALTVQSTTGVREMHPIPGSTVTATLDCLEEDLPPAGIKIGMLATSDNVEAVRKYVAQVRANRSLNVVLDPVIRSSSGTLLLDEEGSDAIREGLLAEVDWVTPNTAELAILSGIPLVGPGDVPAACLALQERVGMLRTAPMLGIFAKGGHLEKPDDYLLTPAGEGTWIPGGRVATSSTHGTGCALSSAFLSRLVLGKSAKDSARLAKEYVAGALRTASPIGAGSGPINHLWMLIEAQDSE